MVESWSAAPSNVECKFLFFLEIDDHWRHREERLLHEASPDREKKETVHTLMRNRVTSHILKHYLFTYLTLCAWAELLVVAH